MLKKTNLLKLLLLLCFILACRNEDFSLQNNEAEKAKDFQISYITNGKILDNPHIAAKIKDLQKNTFRDIPATAIKDSLLDGASIDTQTVMLSSLKGVKTYTFAIKRSYASSKIENIVLRENSNHSISGIFTQYKLNAIDKGRLNSNLAIENIKSKTRYYPLDKIGKSKMAKSQGCGITIDPIYETCDCGEALSEARTVFKGYKYTFTSGCFESAEDYMSSGGGFGLGNNGNGDNGNGDTSNGGGGGSSTGHYSFTTNPFTTPGSTPDDTPCNKIKKLLTDNLSVSPTENTTVLLKANELKVFAATSEHIEHGFGVTFDNRHIDLGDGDHGLKIIIDNLKLAYHNHTLSGAAIYSPADLDSMLSMARNTQAIENALHPNAPASVADQAYLGLITPEGRNYLINFIGDSKNIPTFTKDQLKAFKEKYKEQAGKFADEYDSNSGPVRLSESDLFKLYDYMVEIMNLKNLIQISTIDKDGNVSLFKNDTDGKLKRDPNGDPIEVECP